MTTFDEVCATLESMLAGPARAEIVRDAAAAGSLGSALIHLRKAMRPHVWRVNGATVDLERAIQRYDRRTRSAGFHVLNDWDGVADRVNDDTIPVDVLHYLVDRRGNQPADPPVLAILVDYYFMHLLALLTLRIWDDGDADANLDRIGGLLARLQGEHGSGQQFADDAETLLLIGTSHYELHERGYHLLLERVRTLSPPHQLTIALGHAASMGCHLRFGFEATYGRDTVNMRDDNVADYPWLCFALARLMHEYVRMREQGVADTSRATIVEALLNGLAADARAFLGQAPASLAGCEAERSGFRDRFLAVRQDLLTEFEAHRPGDGAYSPLCFFFNFSHNVLKGVVIDALLNGRPYALSFNDLLTGVPRDSPMACLKAEVATMLMGYARDNPHRIRGRLRPVIVYDVQSGREAFSVAMRKMREQRRDRAEAWRLIHGIGDYRVDFFEKGSSLMTTRNRSMLLIALAAIVPATFASNVHAQAQEGERINNAALVLGEIMAAPDKAIPAGVLEKAEGIAVFPGTIKGGFVLAAQRGKGIISLRDRAKNTWSLPAFMTITGGSIGAQIGGQAIDIVLVIMDRRGLENLLSNQFKVGADGSVTAGPVGRTAEASTDIQLRAQILSYSRSRGLFAGVSLTGAAIRNDEDAAKAFYGEPLTIRAIVLENKAKVTSHADAVAAWQKALAQYAKGK